MANLKVARRDSIRHQVGHVASLCDQGTGRAAGPAPAALRVAEIASIQLAAVNDPIGTTSRTGDTTPAMERPCRDLSTVSHAPLLQHDRTAVAR